MSQGSSLLLILKYKHNKNQSTNENGPRNRPPVSLKSIFKTGPLALFNLLFIFYLILKHINFSKQNKKNKKMKYEIFL